VAAPGGRGDSVRIGLSLGLAVVLAVAGWWLTHPHRASGGWFGYAPNTNVSYHHLETQMSGHSAALVGVGFAVGWLVLSVVILRARHSKQPPPADGT
jgi:hypothetical protein